MLRVIIFLQFGVTLMKSWCYKNILCILDVHKGCIYTVASIFDTFEGQNLKYKNVVKNTDLYKSSLICS